jgi:ribonuclease P protein component
MAASAVRSADMPPGPPGERFPPAERLRRRADFLRCYRQGKRRQSHPALLYFLPNALGHPRLGITASRKVGEAVERHRLKRRIREIYRRSAERRQLPGVDVVVHLKSEAKEVAFSALRVELERLLRAVAAASSRRQSGDPAGEKSRG